MATIGSLVVQSVTDYALDHYVKGDMLLQTEQEKPLLAFLNAGKKTFGGGKQYISEPVKGTVMNDTAGFFAGVTADDALVFTQQAQGVRANYAWKQQHAGLVITFTQLLQDGISVTDGEQKTSDHSDSAMTRLTGILKDALDDFGVSWARAKNSMLWQDGSQDSKQIPGVKALLLDDPTTGTVGGLSQATYSWWRSRKNLTLSPSAENQTMSIFFTNEAIQLRKRGGRPNKALCGSDFWGAMMIEVREKGLYTQTGFADKNVDVGLKGIVLPGIGLLEYDPTLDDLGESKRCYVFDSRRIKLRPIEGEENKTLKPARPYQYMVILKSMTYAGALEVTQLNGQGIYAIS
jgi:hypothetical protein